MKTKYKNIIKGYILSIAKIWDRTIKDNWRSNQTGLRKRLNYTTTNCYLEVKE